MSQTDGISGAEPAGLSSPLYAVSHQPVGRFSRIRRYAPALAFASGFAWDALTLGRRIEAVDLWILLGYLIAAGVVVGAIARMDESKRRRRLSWLFQFLIGGVFSALVIFYFLSSSNAPAFGVVVLLAALLVANEFVDSRQGRMTVAWTMFAVATIMFCNFALPHLLRSVSAFWFYVSSAVGLVVVMLVRLVARDDKSSMSPAVVVAGTLMLLHWFGLIPPVPLVQKQMLIAVSVKRSQGAYLVQTERRGARRLNLFEEQRIHRKAGEPVYCFTSVFVPRGIETTLRHRWMYATSEGEWKSTDVISFPIRGGRDDGYRAYTFKRSVTPGRWRVITESEAGARLGIAEFEVVRGEGRRVRTRRM